MSIEAYLQGGVRPGNRRSSPRRRLHLALPATVDAGAPADGVMRDLSETGFLLQTSTRLALGDRLEINLPHAGLVTADVVWVGDGLYGCQFETPISKATLGAAQLRADPVAEGPEPASSSSTIESFGARLRRLRRQRGISLIGLARLVEVSKPTLWKWERDDARPRQKSIEALARALGLTERELLFGTGEPAPLPAPAAARGGEERSLSEVLRACKEQIARVAGTTAENVTITIQA